MTTILSAYGVYRLTDNVRQGIADDFDQANLVSEPSMLEADRAATLRLRLREAVPHVEEEQLGDAAPRGVTTWQRTRDGWQLTDSTAVPGSLNLVDVDLSLVTNPASLPKFLQSTLHGLDDEAVDDLLTRDSQAALKRSTGETARRASLFVVSRGPGGGADDSDDDIPLARGG